MEAAIGLAVLVVVLVLCLAGVTAVSMQVRCVDAAREAARLAARGDQSNAIGAARRIAPAGADVQVRCDGDFIVSAVTARSRMLPGVTIRGTGLSVLESAVEEHFPAG